MKKDREIQIFKLNRVFKQKANIPILYENIQEKALNYSINDPLPLQLSYTVHRIKYINNFIITPIDFIIEDVRINEYITQLEDKNKYLNEQIEFLGSVSFWKYLKHRFTYRRIK